MRPLEAAKLFDKFGGSVLKKDDILIIMTGTNGDKAVSEWDIDHTVSVTYPELIIAKREVDNG